MARKFGPDWLQRFREEYPPQDPAQAEPIPDEFESEKAVIIRFLKSEKRCCPTSSRWEKEIEQKIQSRGRRVRRLSK